MNRKARRAQAATLRKIHEVSKDPNSGVRIFTGVYLTDGDQPMKRSVATYSNDESITVAVAPTMEEVIEKTDAWLRNRYGFGFEGGECVAFQSGASGEFKQRATDKMLGSIDKEHNQ